MKYSIKNVLFRIEVKNAILRSTFYFYRVNGVTYSNLKYILIDFKLLRLTFTPRNNL